MSGIALLVVDVQRAAIAMDPWEGDAVLSNIAELIAAFRAADRPVIWVRHDSGPGSELAAGTEGWEIHPAVAPADGEPIVDKRFNSAFRKTDLAERLREIGVGRLVVTGIQTEYCVDTTVRVAFELGYDVHVVEMTNTTFDNGDIAAEQIYELHNRRIFADRFATLLTMQEARALLA